MIQQPAFTVEPWALRETAARPGPARADRVGVRAVQRPHRAARQPGRGRAARPAGHATSTASTSCGRCPTRRPATAPGVRPDGHQRDQRQAHPPARRRRAVRRPLRRAARPRARARLPRRGADRAPPSGSRRPGSAVRVSSTRLVSFTPARGSRRSATRSSRSTARPRSWCSPSWWPTSSCPRQRRPAGGGRAGPPLDRRVPRRRRTGARSCVHSTTAQRAAGRRGDGPPDRGPDRAPRSTSRPPRRRPGHRDRGPEPGQRLRVVKFVAYGWSARALAAGASVTRSAAALAQAQQHRLGRAARRAARLPRRLLGARRRRGRRGRRGPAGGALRAVPRAAGRRPGGATGDPAKGLTGPGYDGHAFWDTETFVLPVLTYTAPGRRRRRAALAAQHAAAGRGARPPARPERAPRSRGGRSPARSARATGRRAPPPSTSTPTSPTRSSATCDATGDEEFEREHRPGAARRRPRGCGARSATTTPRGGSASTASPARTSTARSPTTTSTPT